MANPKFNRLVDPSVELEAALESTSLKRANSAKPFDLQPIYHSALAMS